ncbi:endonuclease [Actinoplanes sp. SE50]|uniref:endonuclease/exonuclease/phosphatase family protein n=1 Tax=unclassified Actinoplanes TaxID=2626549 RepID=UPI00023ECA2F|nr:MULTISPECIES: endonuclease/exonuclease/phosphatase family protein [unclassified Actinoplanes]AEV87673.1 endonuclease/exonuclease/phosphatase [Actinoplanes sp. SE50/110]ATO86076.1 endonuclease [Actinoplanes sp. SE50]SLM03490.1 endonuclease [Actinoplanes sp. SE50/110]
MRMMTWNIKTGGVDRGHRFRLPAIAEVIAAEKPDILTLQELRDFQRGGERRMHELASAVGMTPYLARSGFGMPVGVLVRDPLRITRTTGVTWRLHHAAAVVVVATPSGPLTVISAHLDPFSPYRRMREARWLAARHARSARVLLAGDLNGLDPVSDHTEALASQQSMFRKRHLYPDGTVDSRALAAFGDAGLVDLWSRAGSGDGRTVPTTEGGGREFGGMRLDYVLATPAVADGAHDMRVVRGGAAEHASDHYPVRVDLDL